MAVRTFNDDAQSRVRSVRLNAGGTAGELAGEAGAGLDEELELLGSVRLGGCSGRGGRGGYGERVGLLSVRHIFGTGSTLTA